MGWLTQKVWGPFRRCIKHRSGSPKSRRPVRRLEVEVLEDRRLLSATVAPSLSGVAFVDRAGTGVFQQGDAILPGISVDLTGTTYLGTSINATTTTDAKGAFQFLLVPNGTYQLNFGPASGFLGGGAQAGSLSVPAGVSIISGVPVSGGQSVSAGLSFRGLDPSIISLRMFLASASGGEFPLGAPGTGSAAASGPFLRRAGGIPATSLARSSSTQLDLAGFFSAPDLTTSDVVFTVTSNPDPTNPAQRVTSTIHVQLTDGLTPQTVANFLDYVQSGAFTNSIFHRIAHLATDGLSVLQGGGATVQTVSGSTTLSPITVLNTGVANEFSASNVLGTIAMAQSTGPNSATDQFFFNLIDNSQALDPQQFTVFGKVMGTADLQALATLGATPTHDESATPFATGTPKPLPDVGLNSLPLNPASYATNDSAFPTNTTADNYLVVSSVAVTRQNEALTYTVSSSDPSVTASIHANTRELLTLQAGSSAGSSTITVTATDQFGNSKQVTFQVTVT